MWTKLSTGNQHAWLLSSTRFRVRTGTITYIGHIRVFVADNRFNVAVVDRESEMREHLKAHFPVYAASMPFEKVLAELRVHA